MTGEEKRKLYQRIYDDASIQRSFVCCLTPEQAHIVLKILEDLGGDTRWASGGLPTEMGLVSYPVAIYAERSGARLSLLRETPCTPPTP